ncbi:hypothetical protein EV44_g5900 [Erysiphe necator]|uniref:Uncharacterized protein n=1 Tax=Uncinula necator TaxID=52586 RepID=A0A0B1PEA7_UNCNE|nr:hypothetical protein EV44_g5900 [Erysiphe necator]
MSQGMNNAIDMLGLSGSPDAKTTPEETLSQLMSGPIGELMSSSLSGAQTDGSASSQVGQLAGSVAWLLLGGSTSTTSSNAKEAKSNSSDSSVAPNKEPVQESSSASDAVGIGRIGTLFLLAITISTIPKFWCAI